ncbi:MAG: hypothetical protein IJT18_03555, partial [Oscillospiraceae bacterium]|nr:hypothetical protein [Oscillospiraceae bacterium]
ADDRFQTTPQSALKVLPMCLDKVLPMSVLTEVDAPYKRRDLQVMLRTNGSLSEGAVSEAD